MSTFENIRKFTLMNHIDKYIEKVLSDDFKKFQKTIKNCATTLHMPFKWHASDVCIRDRNCFQIKHERKQSKNSKSLEQIDCPCPKNNSNYCSSNYCSLNKETCDSFSIKAVNAKAKNDWQSKIRKCGNDFISKG